MPGSYEFSEIPFSFMVSGPRYSVAIPDYCSLVPELSAPLANPNGARSFDFLPYWQENQISPTFPMIRTFTDKEGRTVELYRWLEEPPQWFLRWPLTNGNLWTHLRPEDGEEMAETTVGSVSILDDSTTGLPFVLPETPLRSAVSSRPGYQEFCVFLSTKQPGWAVSVQRPSHIDPGKMMSDPSAGDQVILRAGAAYGIEIQVMARTDMAEARNLAHQIVQSLKEG